MTFMVDTNVIIDYLAMREPFFAESADAVDTILREGGTCMVSSSAITDIHCIIRKLTKSNTEARLKTAALATALTIAPVTGEDIMAALCSGMDDFEDAVLAECARSSGADWIITRNLKDFGNSPIPPISPGDVPRLLGNARR